MLERDASLAPRPVTSFPWHRRRANSAPNTYRGSAAGSDRAPRTRPVGGVRGHALSRPRNTFVPSCRPTQERGAGVRAQGARRPLSPGSGEGQRSGRALRALVNVLERERVSNQGFALPGVRAHDARRVFAASGETDHVISVRHLGRAPPCRARVRRRAHPLSSVSFSGSGPGRRPASVSA